MTNLVQVLNAGGMNIKPESCLLPYIELLGDVNKLLNKAQFQLSKTEQNDVPVSYPDGYEVVGVWTRSADCRSAIGQLVSAVTISRKKTDFRIHIMEKYTLAEGMDPILMPIGEVDLIDCTPGDSLQTYLEMWNDHKALLRPTKGPNNGRGSLRVVAGL